MMTCATYSTGATKRKANSSGSVIPVRKDVSAAESMIEPTLTRFSGLEVRQMASAAPGRPNILNRKPPPSLPAFWSPSRKQVSQPWSTAPVSAFLQDPTS